MFNGGVEEDAVDVGVGRVVSSSFEAVGSSATPGDVGGGPTAAAGVVEWGARAAAPVRRRRRGWAMG